MGLGPINAIYQARFNRYLQNRQHRRHQPSPGVVLPRRRRVRRARDARRDLAGRPRAARQPDLRRQLQPAAPRRPGARQRQDHPGARGRVPRRRLERHQGDLGLEVGRAARPGHRRRAAQQDEHHRRRRVPALRASRPAPTSASTSSGPTPACARWSSTSPTTSCATCPAAATTTASSTPPTRPPPRTSDRRADGHPGQDDQGLDARPGRRGPQRHPPDQEDDRGAAARCCATGCTCTTRSPTRRSTATTPPYFRPPEDSIEYQYMMERRQALDGSLPRRAIARAAGRSSCPADERVRRAARPARASRRCRPRWPSPACCATSAATSSFGQRVVPIIPDEARTFGMDALFRELKIYAVAGPEVRAGRPRPAALATPSRQTGQILEEGITEAGSMASFIAAGTAYATRGVPMVPFYIFYSMFGFQRVGDLIWQAADARARGLPARRHRRAHDAARRGPAAPGRPQPRARLDGAAVPGLRPGVRLRGGDHRASTASSACTAPAARATSSTTSRSTTRTTRCRPMPDDVEPSGIVAGLYRWADGARRADAERPRSCSPGSAQGAAREAADRAGRALRRRRRAVVGHVVQAAPRGGAGDRALEPPAPRRAARAAPLVTELLGDGRRARSSRSPTS